MSIESLQPIPEQSLPPNGLILLEIRATAPSALPAVATVVLQVVTGNEVTPLPNPVFAQTFYEGSYTAPDILNFDTPISLSEGYHPDVNFKLEGGA